jgi:hypothetical protein
MTSRPQILAAVTLLLGSDGARLSPRWDAAPAVPFATASVYFEQNATDRDVEIVFEVKGGDEGLSKLTVTSPDGRTVIDFTAPNASTLGIRQFRFESPESGDVAGLKAAYPAGVYTFVGATAAGGTLRGESTLDHTLPATASFVRPRAGARGVSARGLEITWTPVKDLAAYIVYIEQDELQVSLTTRLPGSVARFAVPDSFLLPATAYVLGIGTVTARGNSSFVETTFTTAGKE